ncbi:MAG: hypothetical protein AAFY21_14565 [Cyanobacteria bacterium J06641_2]
MKMAIQMLDIGLKKEQQNFAKRLDSASNLQTNITTNITKDTSYGAHRR